jgi:RNA polymerase sigma factor (sigma-70 family)
VSPSDSSLSIYIEHRDDLLNYANKYLQDRAIAEDVVQEAWIRLSARDGRGDEIGHPLSYLYSIVRNLALDWMRRGPREKTVTTETPPWDTMVDPSPSSEVVVLHRDEMRALMEAISELSEKVQTAFRMYRLEEKTLQEVASHLNVSIPRAHQMVREAGLHATERLFGDEDGSPKEIFQTLP